MACSEGEEAGLICAIKDALSIIFWPAHATEGTKDVCVGPGQPERWRPPA